VQPNLLRFRNSEQVARQQRKKEPFLFKKTLPKMLKLKKRVVKISSHISSHIPREFKEYPALSQYVNRLDQYIVLICPFCVIGCVA
jgi:hypothetical protein